MQVALSLLHSLPLSYLLAKSTHTIISDKSSSYVCKGRDPPLQPPHGNEQLTKLATIYDILSLVSIVITRKLPIRLYILQQEAAQEVTREWKNMGWQWWRRRQPSPWRLLFMLWFGNGAPYTNPMCTTDPNSVVLLASSIPSFYNVFASFFFFHLICYPSMMICIV